MNRTKDVRGGRKRLRIAISVLVAAGITTFGIMSIASASNVTCHGRVAVDPAHKRDRVSLSYRIKCDQELKAYSILTSRSIDSVDPEVQVFKGSHGISSTEAYGCEADIPGRGFGCSPAPPSVPAAAGRSIRGKFGLENRYCRGKKPLEVWLTAVTVQDNDPGPGTKLYTTSSQPIQLRVVLPHVRRNRC